MRIGGCGERGWRRLPRPQLGRGRGLTCVVPRQPPARPPARDSLQSPRNLSSLRVWQRCLEKGSAEAARSRSSPSCSPTPRALPLHLPALRLRPQQPPSSDGACCRSPAGGANLEQLRGPSGKKLGAIGSEGKHPSLGAGAQELPGRLDSRGQEKELAGFGESSSGARRTCRSVWSKDCSVAGGGERLSQLPAVLGTRAGWGLRDGSLDPHPWDLPFRVAFLEMADNTWNCHSYFFGR